MPNEVGSKPLRRATDQVTHRVPPPRLYVYFDAIIRYGSIRSAAESLRIASSALNRRLLDLEHEMGTKLFDRLQTGVRLTPAGELLARHVRRTLHDIAKVGDEIEGLRGATHGHVAIGSAESAAVELLPQALAGFQQLYPGMRFTVAVGAPGTMLTDLLEDRVDLILTHEEPRHPDVTVLATARKSFCALMRAEHPLAGYSSLLIRECQAFPIVLAQEQLAARSLVDAALVTGLLAVQPALVTNMFEVMKRYVSQTDAISFQFMIGSLADVAAGGLAAVPLADPKLAGTSLVLAVRRGRALPQRVTRTCAMLQKLLKGKPAR